MPLATQNPTLEDPLVDDLGAPRRDIEAEPEADDIDFRHLDDPAPEDVLTPESAETVQAEEADQLGQQPPLK